MASRFFEQPVADVLLHPASDPKPGMPGYKAVSDSTDAVATCDFCGAWQRIPATLPCPTCGQGCGHNVALALNVLGWTKRGTRDACPNCS